MTLIVGVRCTDGIVLGADGAATYTSILAPTIKQQVKKIRAIKSRVAFAGAGPLGLLGLYFSELEQLWTTNACNKKLPDVIESIREAFWKHYDPVYKQAQQIIAQLRGLALLEATAPTLIVIPIGKQIHLIQIDEVCVPSEVGGDQLFVAMGSGQQVAEPFLAYLRKLFWGNNQPTLVQGIFSTLWVLEYAIQSSAFGLGEPKQIVTVAKDKTDKWTVHELTDAELEEQMQAVGEAEEHLRSFADRFKKVTPAEQIPQPPKANS